MTRCGDITARNDALLAWYDEHRRQLPWREAVDPYLTLVSEAMLQQTQVARVVPRFEEFVERWPDAASLAEATTDEVLAAWSGLGYNSRAIRLRDAAIVVARDGWPTSIKGLRALPGVGPYTAAAIASIAFGEPVAAVDTNLRRVISRWVGAPLSGSDLDRTASDLVTEPAGRWNQALMDLGATVCRPADPKCGVCPVAAWCADPTVYEAPPRQSRFEGSRRQLRGALVRAHLDGDDPAGVGRGLGRTEDEVDEAIADLRSEGILPS